ncbi:hypothetical protein [Symbiopectobacterium purcellii]|uniref:Uncharacterized protein n=1 Tax=Symbiopectobacterium purcellii TaxID=2871826 RepID=A0ABX9AFV8_9ENTR|nr:hypothetical protein [Symbiopectobacterium purcellii]QZN94054.1 hypothetical protein K6K13_11640 [Symbiopectobacterium purcellii]
MTKVKEKKEKNEKNEALVGGDRVVVIQAVEVEGDITAPTLVVTPLTMAMEGQPPRITEALYLYIALFRQWQPQFKFPYINT